jgi:hypothetical protein
VCVKGWYPLIANFSLKNYTALGHKLTFFARSRQRAERF